MMRHESRGLRSLTDTGPNTFDGVPDAETTTHEYRTADGLALSMQRFTRETSGDAVLVVPGLSTSTDMYVMPEHRNLVTCLLDEGYDVWCLDFRMSMRQPYNATSHRWTFDDCAQHDFAPALELIRARRPDLGPRGVHVIAHCLGSLTVAMALAAGCVGGIGGVVLNSVGLLPRVPWWSAVKLRLGPDLFSLFGVDVLDPTWTAHTGTRAGRIVARAVGLVHRECDVPACHLLSTMWGTGWPALYEHANLDERTHRRARELFGVTSVHYYRHVDQMVRAGAAVRFRPHRPEHRGLPDDYLARAAAIDTPLLLTTGSVNRVFTDSNVAFADRLRELGGRRHELRVFEGYGHQDVFMGRNAARDVFPHLLEFLSRVR